MIQRVQSVYLLLVTILMSFLLVQPYAELKLTDGQTLAFRSSKIVYNAGSEKPAAYRITIEVVLLAMITGLLSFVNIFLFSRRVIQLRICLLNTLLMVLLLIIMLIHYISARHALDTSHHAFRLAGIFPVAALVINALAYRNIQKDELIVNSYNRIR